MLVAFVLARCGYCEVKCKSRKKNREKERGAEVEWRERDRSDRNQCEHPKHPHWQRKQQQQPGRPPSPLFLLRLFFFFKLAICLKRGETLDSRKRLCPWISSTPPPAPDDHTASGELWPSHRQRDLAFQVAEQMCNAAAASSLFLLPTCVRWHVSAALAASP